MSTLISKLTSIFICATVSMNILAAQDSAKVVILSSMVGEVIDVSEREYYHLFPAIQYFISAVIVKLPDGKYEARFTTGPSTAQKLISVEMPEALVDSLAETIEYFEELETGSYIMGTHRPAIQIVDKVVTAVDGKTVEYKPDLQSSQIDRSVFKQNEDANTIVINTRGGEQYGGRILCFNDSALVVWRSILPYNVQELNRLAILIPFFEIDRVLIEKEGHLLSGLGIGLLVGGGIGAAIGFANGDDKGGFLHFSAAEKAGLGSILLGILGAVIGGVSGAVQGTDDNLIIGGDGGKYRAILSVLKKNAIFYSILPSELQDLLMKTKEKFPSHTVESVPPSNMH